jgi:hypothetical protein
MCKETTRLGGMVVFGGKVVFEEVFEEGCLVIQHSRITRQKVAVRQGFEPWDGYKPSHTFQACALSHSAISPYCVIAI